MLDPSWTRTSYQCKGATPSTFTYVVDSMKRLELCGAQGKFYHCEGENARSQFIIMLSIYLYINFIINLNLKMTLETRMRVVDPNRNESSLNLQENMFLLMPFMHDELVYLDATKSNPLSICFSYVHRNSLFILVVLTKSLFVSGKNCNSPRQY